MAKIEFKGLREYEEKLEELSDPKEIRKLIKYATYPAAGMIIEEIKKAAPYRTGDLHDSLGLSPFREQDGFVYTQVTVSGRDRYGTPNALKARVLESGRSNLRKRRFIANAVRRKKKAAVALMQTMVDKYLYEKFRK